MAKELYEFDHIEWKEMGKIWKESWSTLGWCCGFLLSSLVTIHFLIGSSYNFLIAGNISGLLGITSLLLKDLKTKKVYFRRAK